MHDAGCRPFSFEGATRRFLWASIPLATGRASPSPLRRLAMQPRNKTDLTPRQRYLIELMQTIHFGCIRHLTVRDGEPEVTPDTVIEREIKLGGQNGPRPERDQDDFALKHEVVALLEQLAHLDTGSVCLLEIKHGLPFLMRIAERAA
jgi:hypothetical protein